jgi:hypothetical protein
MMQMTRDDRSATVAQTILISAFKIVLPGGETRISAINDIITALAGEKESRWTRRDISRQVEASADKLAQRLAEFESHEFPGLDEGDKAAAISAVCESLTALHITKEEIIDKSASVKALYAVLEPAAYSRWRKSFGLGRCHGVRACLSARSEPVHNKYRPGHAGFC